jgi:drug/metabolite transporter (DMT)-like permease
MKQSDQVCSHTNLRSALLLGFAASAFFSFSFVLNRQMATLQGHWAWSAALRYLMALPVLLLIIVLRKQWGKLLEIWKLSPFRWCWYGTLSCVLFYSPLVLACTIAPAWFVAATWPVSIVFGIVLSPFLYKDNRRIIPRNALFFSILIILGVLLLQASEFQSTDRSSLHSTLLLVLVSAVAHPIGNRGSMLLFEKAKIPADPFVRLCLLILGSLPIWLTVCGWGFIEGGWPSAGQLSTITIIAGTGLIATPLFYAATDRVSHSPKGLAAVESTQAGEIVFTLIFETLLIGIDSPTIWSWVGLLLILLGFVLHARPVPSTQQNEMGL